MTDEHHDHECGCGCEHDECSDIYPPYFIVGIAGFFLVALLLVFSSITYLEVFFHDNNYAWDNFNMFYACASVGVFASLCLLAVAAYGFFKELHNESVFFLLFGIAMLTMSYPIIKGSGLSDDTWKVMDIIFGLSFLIPSAVFVIKGEILLAIAGFLCAISYIAFELISPDSVVYGTLALLSGLIFAYVAFANLVFYETGGSKVLPLK